jgi:superfamily II DNA/RNA helicase
MTGEKIFDNSDGNELVQVIKDRLRVSKIGKFAIGYFYLSGFKLVEEDFPISEDFELRMVMGNDTNSETKTELVLGHQLRESMQQSMIENLQNSNLSAEETDNLSRLVQMLRSGIIKVKLYDSARLHAKLYLFLTRPEEKYISRGEALVGSSNFTYDGLNMNKELNVMLMERNKVEYLDHWFDSLWEEAQDFNQDLLKIVDISSKLPKSDSEKNYPNLGKLVSPEELFKYLVYRWFDGRVASLSKKDILAEFQLVGVVNSIRMLDFYNGVIIADSVGLGKSFLGMAILEDYIEGRMDNWWKDQSRSRSALLVLPPSVINQWEEILTGELQEEDLERYRNHQVIQTSSVFFTGRKIQLHREDKPNHKIISFYDNSNQTLGTLELFSTGLLQTDQGLEQEIEKMRDRYDVILVDEAHKFRNANSLRWGKLRKLNTNTKGKPNKMVLLTATPINNSVYDLYNLVRLFTDDAFPAFRMAGLGDIPKLFSDYLRLFNELKADDDKKKSAELKKVAGDIQKKVVDEVVLLRTRKYIKDNFPDLEINGERIQFSDPKPYPLDYSDFANSYLKTLYSKIAEILPKLEFEHTKMYGAQMVTFSEASFDKDGKDSKRFVLLADIFRLLLGKRLESGIFPFEVTLQKIYAKEYAFYTAFILNLDQVKSPDDLKQHLLVSLKAIDIDPDKDSKDDIFTEEELESDDSQGWFENVLRTINGYSNNFQEGIQAVCENMANDLKNIKVITDLFHQIKEVDSGGVPVDVGKLTSEGNHFQLDRSIFSYTNDPKLDALKNLLGKIQKRSKTLEFIPNLFGQKVIIFTQYKDTAYYLFHHLQKWAEDDPDIHPILNQPDRNNHKGRSKVGLVTGDTDSSTRANTKKRFAPKANRGEEEVQRFGELQILVTTDAFSEGVNLQDANAVVNFDLPWNPMILVQRVGRINRIGNDKEVIVVNYVPSLEVGALVSVMKKLQEKIKDITLLIGKESRILEEKEIVDEKTFGERIQSLAEKSMTELEQEYIPEELQGVGSQKQKVLTDEFRLLQEIQFKRGYRPSDFEEVGKWVEDGKPRYSFVQGDNRIYSIYELTRGSEENQKSIERKILSSSLGSNPQIEEESPFALLKLLDKPVEKPKQLFKIAELLLEMGSKNKVREKNLQQDSITIQRGFLEKLSDKIAQETITRWGKNSEMSQKANKVLNSLNAISPQKYTSELKPLLSGNNLISETKGTINLINPDKVLDTLYEYFQKKGISDLDYSVETLHYGWFLS